jgi:outer membrane protein, heavy metal efflux system
MRGCLRALTGVGLLLVAGCAGSVNRGAMDEWQQVEADLYAQRGLERHAPEAALPSPATLSEYIVHALRHNPGLAAAFARWRAAIAQVPQATSLPDPQLSFSVLIDQIDQDPGYMGERYALSQMFPWFGKLRLQGDVAGAAALAEGRRFEAERLALVDRVTRAYTEVAYVDESLVILRANLDLLADFEAVARSRYRAGTASLADVNRAQVELARIEDQISSLADRYEVSVAELNASLGRPARTPLVHGPARLLDEQPASLPDHDDAQWLALAREHNPGLAVLRQEMTGQAAAVDLARRQYRPDIGLGIEYTRGGSRRMAMMDGGGADMLMGMVSFNLPVRRGALSAGVEEARARSVAAARRLEDRQANLEAELQRALFAYRDSERRRDLYGSTILPRARQSLAATEAAYRVGGVGFADLIDAQRVLLEFALAHVRAAADRLQAIAGIAALVGQAPEGPDSDPLWLLTSEAEVKREVKSP